MKIFAKSSLILVAALGVMTFGVCAVGQGVSGAQVVAQPPIVIDQTNMTATSPAATLANTDQAGAQYVLGPGDVISVTVSPQTKYSIAQTPILEDGTIIYPTIGVMTAQGRTVEQFTDDIKWKLDAYCVDPSVAVSVDLLRPQVVYISGGVQAPKVVDLRAGSNVAKAITLAGGAVNRDALAHVAIVRGSTVIVSNIYPLMIDGVDNGQNYPLQSGDLVIVPTDTQWVTVVGQVQKPGQYGLEMNNPSSNEGQERLADAIGDAGGIVAHGAALNSVRIVRLSADKTSTQVVYVDYGKYLKTGNPVNNPVLSDKDIIFVPNQRSQADPLSSVTGILAAIGLAGVRL